MWKIAHLWKDEPQPGYHSILQPFTQQKYTISTIFFAEFDVKNTIKVHRNIKVTETQTKAKQPLSLNFTDNVAVYG